MLRVKTLITLAGALSAAFAMSAPLVWAAEVSIREITAAVFKATRSDPLDYSGKDLSYLDFSGIDFKAARMKDANLFGADFTGANLKDTNLSGALLDRTTIIRADFSGANLSGATMLVPAAFINLSQARNDAPRFTAANLQRFRVNGEYWRVDFRGADLTEANFSPHSKRFGDTTISVSRRTAFRSCDFSGAKMVRAQLARVLMHFSVLAGADLTDADLTDSDLSKADLSGANLTRAKVAGADFDGADLRGVRGLDTAIGLDQAVNLDRAYRE